MKYFFILFSLFIYSGCLSAQNIDSLGLDNNPILSKNEAEYFNKALASQRQRFDFTNKKIAFLEGTSGSVIIAKQNFFKLLVLPYLAKKEKANNYFVILHDQEKLDSGGYDAFIMQTPKVFTDKNKRLVISKLKEGN